MWLPVPMLTEKKRLKLLRMIASVVEDNFYDAETLQSEWPRAVKKHTDRIVGAPSDEAFENAVGELLLELKSSHIGFYHAGFKRCSSKMAICATYSAFALEDGERWVFQDVHEGGPAARAGIRPGDVLISVGGRSFQPPEHPHFPTDENVTIEVLTRDMRRVRGTLKIPAPKVRSGQLPYVDSKPDVSYRRLNLDTGYIRVTRYPGDIGVEVANEISAAVKDLQPMGRLIIDLRGNSGGGIGVLRLMSLLTDQRLVAGKFTKGGIVRTDGIEKYGFLLNRIPTWKAGLYPLGVRYFSSAIASRLAKRKHQVTVMTEGLSPQPFHGRVVLLVDRHTASANEILLAFAQDHGLATLVGEASPGRMLGGENFKLLYDYWLVIPRGSFRTDAGSEIEGRPIIPDVPSPFDPEQARLGRDLQLEKAIEVVAQL